MDKLTKEKLDLYIAQNYIEKKPILFEQKRRRGLLSKKEKVSVNRDDALTCAVCDDVSVEEPLYKSTNIESYMNLLDKTFQETLFYFIDKKNLSDVDVYNRACLDRRLFSKIRSDRDYKPSRKTAISLCIGCLLSMNETNTLLEKAGYTLSKSSKADLIIRYCIENGIFNMRTINDYLYEYHVLFI